MPCADRVFAFRSRHCPSRVVPTPGSATRLLIGREPVPDCSRNHPYPRLGRCGENPSHNDSGQIVDGRYGPGSSAWDVIGGGIRSLHITTDVSTRATRRLRWIRALGFGTFLLARFSLWQHLRCRARHLGHSRQATIELAEKKPFILVQNEVQRSAQYLDLLP